MKKYKILLIAIFASIGQLFASGLKDTIVINFDNGASVQIISSEYSQLSEYKQLNFIVSDFQKGLESIIDKAPDYERFSILFYNNKITFKELEKQEEFIKELNTFNRNELKSYCKILSVKPMGCCGGRVENFEIIIWFKEIKQLLDTNFQYCINKTIKMLPKKSAIFKKIFYNCNDTLVKFSHEEPYESPNVDCLSITAGMGTGVIKSDLQLSFVVTCGLLLGKNGLVKHNIYLSDEFFYIYNDNNNFDINAFANLGYKYNFSSDKEKPSYKGIEAGYLVRRSGDFFDKNTFRFGVAASQKRLNGKVYLYFPGGIKHAYPGISLFFNFF